MPSLGPALDASLQNAWATRERLLNPAVAAEVSDLIYSLPDSFTYAGLECRLIDDDRTDVVLCTERRRARALLPFAAGSACGAVLLEWLDSKESLLRDVSTAWIEFDRPRVSNKAVVEGTAWRNAFAFLRVAEAEARMSGQRKLEQLLHALGPEFTTDPRASGEALERALPDGATLLHLATLKHRGEHELRAHVAVSSRTFDRYIDTALPDDAEKRRLTRYILKDFDGALAFQVSERHGVTRPISVELAAEGTAEGIGLWHSLFSRLIETGLAARPRAEAVQAWPGTVDYLPEDAPLRVRVQRFFHVTLRIEAEPLAKSYLYFYPRFIES